MTVEQRERAAATVALEERLVPQVGDPVAKYEEPLTDEEEQDYRNELEALDTAHASAAARLHTLFAG